MSLSFLITIVTFVPRIQSKMSSSIVWNVKTMIFAVSAMKAEDWNIGTIILERMTER